MTPVGRESASNSASERIAPPGLAADGAGNSGASGTPAASESPAARSSDASEGAEGRNAECDARPRRSWTSPLLWALCVVIAYALSPLPVGVALDLLPPRLATRLHAPIRGAYKPLIWLSDRSPRVREFYEWYENLFDV